MGVSKSTLESDVVGEVDFKSFERAPKEVASESKASHLGEPIICRAKPELPILEEATVPTK
jgi:hypothetical protein